jgi:hypothetical protein
MSEYLKLNFEELLEKWPSNIAYWVDQAHLDLKEIENYEQEFHSYQQNLKFVSLGAVAKDCDVFLEQIFSHGTKHVNDIHHFIYNLYMSFNQFDPPFNPNQASNLTDRISDLQTTCNKIIPGIMIMNDKNLAFFQDKAQVFTEYDKIKTKTPHTHTCYIKQLLAVYVVYVYNVKSFMIQRIRLLEALSYYLNSNIPLILKDVESQTDHAKAMSS